MTVSLDKQTESDNMNPFNNNDLFGMQPNTYCMLLHLSQLLMFGIPGLGLAVPIVLWAINKDKNAMVDQHGKIVLNWLLSALIYAVASAVLSVIFVGAITMLALLVLTVVFPIIGGIKANDGILWKYPLSIPFFK